VCVCTPDELTFGPMKISSPGKYYCYRLEDDENWWWVRGGGNKPKTLGNNNNNIYCDDGKCYFGSAALLASNNNFARHDGRLNEVVVTHVRFFLDGFIAAKKKQSIVFESDKTTHTHIYIIHRPYPIDRDISSSIFVSLPLFLFFFYQINRRGASIPYTETYAPADALNISRRPLLLGVPTTRPSGGRDGDG